MNWNLIKNRYDPGDELGWLENELATLEKLGHNAIIISHVPPNNGCVHSWGHRFRGLMERYQNVVRFSLHGHIHDEMFSVARGIKDDKNLLINWAAASVTTYQNRNPAFVVIDIDEEYMIPLNFRTYYFNITKANIEGPKWEFLHDFVGTYGLEDASPNSFEKLAIKMRDDEFTSALYRWNKKRRVTPGLGPCDEKCRMLNYCFIMSTENYQRKRCEGKPELDFTNNLPDALMNFLTNTWIKKENKAVVE